MIGCSLSYREYGTQWLLNFIIVTIGYGLLKSHEEESGSTRHWQNG